MNSIFPSPREVCYILLLCTISFLIGYEVRDGIEESRSAHAVDIRRESIDWHYARGVSSGWHLALAAAVKVDASADVFDALRAGCLEASEISRGHFERLEATLTAPLVEAEADR